MIHSGDSVRILKGAPHWVGRIGLVTQIEEPYLGRHWAWVHVNLAGANLLFASTEVEKVDLPPDQPGSPGKDKNYAGVLKNLNFTE